ncbi:MAG: DUF2199 domain-containing protein [Saprospiraceae bacterium]
MTYFCSHCNTEHEDWPALIFNAPDFYIQLSEEEKEHALLTSDLCVIQHGGQTDRFIRCVMHQKVNEHCRDLEYGSGVSLSEKNYNEYVEHFTRKNTKPNISGGSPIGCRGTVNSFG